MSGRDVDGWIEAVARRLARTSSRRGFLGRVGALLTGAAAVPLLPVARAGTGGRESREPTPDETAIAGPAGDPESCEYWRYCSIDGFLSACCGGTQNTCPPGTEMSRVTWIGTCRNPGDDRDYIISYNDCCGNSLCGRCACNRDAGDLPVYVPSRANDINWCLGTTTTAYNSTVAVVIGVATRS